jgi:hypothetical protein
VLRAYWKDFWFRPSSPTSLAVCRILLFGSLFLFYLRTDFSAWADVAEAFWMPIWLFEGLGLSQPRRDIVEILEGLWKVSLACSCIGLFSRVSTAVAFALGLYLLGLPHNFGGAHHSDAIVVLVFGVMAVSRCGDRWALDNLLGRHDQAPNARPHAAPHPEYTWPIRAVWVTIALVYFAAGVAKLRHGGAEWIVSDNLAVRLVQAHYGVSHAHPLTTWGLHLAQYPSACRVLAAVTVAAELGYPLALVSAHIRSVVVPTLFVIQIAIRLIMGPSFAQLLICHVFWFPWAAVIARFGHQSPEYAGDDLASPSPEC